MNNQTRNLINDFARRIQRAQKMFEDNIVRNDLGSLSAVPAMYAFAANIQNFFAGQEVQRRETELLEHYALLNGDTPTAKALKALANMVRSGDNVVTVKAPAPIYRKPEVDKPTGIDELLTANLRSIFDKYVLLPNIYRKPDILDGMVPTTFAPQSRNHEGKKFNHLFPINREAFQNPLTSFKTGVHLPDGWYIETVFDLRAQQHSTTEKRWVVTIKLREFDSGVDWKVLTFMDVIWNGHDFSASPFYPAGDAASLGTFAQHMRFFGGTGALYSPYDIDPPGWYENRGKLSLAVQVYNELENCIHFGTEDMIPRAALRECISEFMRAHNYYADTPENLPEDFIAQQLVDLFKQSGENYNYIEYFNRRNSHYAAVEYNFSKRIDSEIDGEGILTIAFWYYDVRYLTNLAELPEYRTSNYGQHNGKCITLAVDMTHGQRPKLIEYGNTLNTLATLNVLLDFAVAIQQRAKNEQDGDK